MKNIKEIDKYDHKFIRDKFLVPMILVFTIMFGLFIVELKGNVKGELDSILITSAFLTPLGLIGIHLITIIITKCIPGLIRDIRENKKFTNKQKARRKAIGKSMWMSICAIAIQNFEIFLTFFGSIISVIEIVPGANLKALNESFDYIGVILPEIKYISDFLVAQALITLRRVIFRKYLPIARIENPIDLSMLEWE